MRITYVARSFLDYRVPVLAALDELAEGRLSLISSTKWTPERALNRLKTVLGDRAIYLSGERSLGTDVPAEANTTFCLPFQPGLQRAITSTRPDVVVGDGFFQWTYAALLHRLQHQTPLVICYERWAHTERNVQWYRRTYRALALKVVSAVCCNGRLSEDYVCSLRFPRTRITRGHMAADTDRLAALREAVDPAEIARLRCSWSATRLVLLYVGQLIKRKGLEQLLHGWREFEALAQGQATLVLIGGGPEDSALKAQAELAKLRHVVCAGPVDYEHLAPYYAAADAFIIPTLEDNWSLVVPEAMACALPIVCSKYNGCWPELVQEGRNGWVFDPLITSDTLRALQDCLRNKGRLTAMGQESRLILKDHTPQKAGEAIFDACRIALAAGTAPAPHPQCSCTQVNPHAITATTSVRNPGNTLSR